MQHLSSLASKYAALKSVLKWLIADPLKQSKKDVLRVVFLQAVSTVFQVLGFIVVIRFAGLLLNNWTFDVFGISYDLQPYKQVTFWSVFAASFVFLLTGAAFAFLARKITAKLARITEEQVLLQVTRVFVQSFSSFQGKTGSLPDLSTLKSFYSRGGRFAGRMVMAVTSALVPFLFMGISLIVLIYLKPVLTLSLLLILVLAVPVFIWVARKGSQASSDLLQHARDSTLDRNRHLDSLRLSMRRPWFSPEKDDVWINRTQATMGFMDAYERRLRITALSTFFTQAVIAVMLTAILLAAVYPAVLGQDIAVVSTLMYLAAFKFFGSGLIAVINAFVTLNVFYSYCQDMVPFLEQSADRADNVQMEDMDGADANQSSGNDSYPLVRGEPVAVNLYTEIDWSTIPLVISALSPYFHDLEPSWVDRCRLLSPQTPLLNDDLPDQMHESNKETIDDIISGLHAMAKNNKNLQKQMRYIQPESLSNTGWYQTPAEIKLLAQGLVLRKENGPLLVFIHGTSLINVPPEVQRKVINLLKRHYIFVVIPGRFKYKHVSENLFQIFACISPDGITWIGDFSRAKEEDITMDQFLEQEEDKSQEAELLEEM